MPDIDPDKHATVSVRKLAPGDDGYVADDPHFELEVQRRVLPRKRVVSLAKITARLAEAVQGKATATAEWDARIQHLTDLKASLEAAS